MRKVAVLIRRLPMGTLKCSEALRVGVGLTLSDNQVTAIFIGDGVWSATGLKPQVIKGPEFKKHIETLKMLGHRLVVDEDSLRLRGIGGVWDGVEVKPRPEILKILDEAEVVIPF